MDPEEFVELIHGSLPPHMKRTGELRCDACFSPIAPPTEVGGYASNVDVGEESRRPLKLNMMFCADCNPRQIRLPKFGIVEIQLTTDMVDEGGIARMENPRIDETAKTRDGVNWDPAAVWEEVADMPLPELQGGAVTPAHVAEVLYQAGVDVRDIIDENGQMDFSDQSRPECREAVEAYILQSVEASL